ncbi:MAG: hypothetical protein ACRDWT_01605 [Jatrophihabitantaceae bacterium]
MKYTLRNHARLKSTCSNRAPEKSRFTYSTMCPACHHGPKPAGIWASDRFRDRLGQLSTVGESAARADADQQEGVSTATARDTGADAMRGQRVELAIDLPYDGEVAVIGSPLEQRTVGFIERLIATKRDLPHGHRAGTGTGTSG